MLDRTSRLRPADAATLRSRISISYCSGRYRKYCRLYVAEEASGRDLGFQINSYDRSPPRQSLCGPCFETFYAKIQRLTRAVGRCCPLESGIDSAPLSMSDLSFENSGAYKTTVLRNQPAPETVKLFSFLPTSDVLAYLNTLKDVLYINFSIASNTIINKVINVHE